MVIKPVQDWRNLPLKCIGYFATFPLTALMFLFVRIRYFYYRYYGKHHLSETPVIIIGSVLVGGSGKTPLTEYLALECYLRGYRPAVVSGGFKKQSKGEVIVYDGQCIQTSAEKAGDEAMMMAMRFFEQSAPIPVVSGKNRINALRLIKKQFNSDLVIFDDGLQYMKLKAAIEIATMDIERLRKRPLPLPWGNLRDTVARLKNVHSLLITKIQAGDYAGNRMIQSMKEYTRSETVLDSFYIPYYLKSWSEHNRINEQDLNKKRIIPFSGLASNESFFRMAEKMLKPFNTEILRRLGFPDHHWYTRADCRKLFGPFQNQSDIYWITTEKDAVRLKKEWIPESVYGKILVLVCRTEVSQSNAWIDAMMSRLFTKTRRNDLTTNGEITNERSI